MQSAAEVELHWCSIVLLGSHQGAHRRFRSNPRPHRLPAAPSARFRAVVQSHRGDVLRRAHVHDRCSDQCGCGCLHCRLPIRGGHATHGDANLDTSQGTTSEASYLHRLEQPLAPNHLRLHDAAPNRSHLQWAALSLQPGSQARHHVASWVCCMHSAPSDVPGASAEGDVLAGVNKSSYYRRTVAGVCRCAHASQLPQSGTVAPQRKLLLLCLVFNEVFNPGTPTVPAALAMYNTKPRSKPIDMSP